MRDLRRILYGLLELPRRLRDRLYCARLRDVCALAEGAQVTPDVVIHNALSPDRIAIGAQTLFMGEIVVIRDGKVQIGAWCYVGPNAKIWSMSGISIGDRVFLSHGVHVFDNNSHSLSASDRASRFRELREHGRHLTPEPVASAPVQIHDDVWIGFNAAVLKGVTIGRGAVIGACAVITHDVEPYAVMVGNPARKVGDSRS